MPTGDIHGDAGPHPAGAAGGGGGIAAPYGRACTNCSRAKCKCILRPAGGACERCYRLNKTCQPSNPQRKRSKKPPSSRTAQLEEKLDGLVTLLRQSGGRPELVDMANISGTASPEGTGYGDGDDFLPSPDEAEALFESFRGQNLRYFPFLHFRPTMTARELRSEKPFLWICIMTVASRVASQQLALGTRVRQIVGQKLLVENERSIDYLLGLLVVLGWANHQLGNKPFMCLFCQIAIGLVFDLGLNKDPVDGMNPFLCWKAAQERADREKNGSTTPASLFLKNQQPRTMEQRRAVLACYMVTSNVASFLGKMDPLRWTPHMDECLQILDSHVTVPSDQALVALVRMQLLKEEAGRLSWRPEVTYDATDGSRTPPSMYVKLLQGQLQKILQNLPTELQSSDTIISQLHCAELSIQEIALSSKTNACVPANLPDVARLDILYACLHAVKAWFEHFFTLPPAAYYAIPFTFFAQLSQCVIALYRLTIFEDPVWDRTSVRNTIDLIATLDEVGDRFMRVCSEAGLNIDVEEGNAFAKAVKTIRGLRGNWESTLGVGSETIDMERPISRGSVKEQSLRDGFAADASLDEKTSTKISPHRSHEQVTEMKDDGGSTTADEGAMEGEKEGTTKAANGSDEAPKDEEYVTGIKLLLVLAALTGTTFLILLDMSIVVTAVPQITTTFNSLADVGCAALQPFAGKLYTHLRSKWIYLSCLFLFELGSLICGVAKSSNMLIVGRAVSGMGSAGLYNGALTIIGNTVPLAKRPMIIGILIGLANMGLVIGPLVGGALTEYSTWRWCFYLNLPIGGVVAVLLALIHIPDRISAPLPLLEVPRHLDLPGCVLFIPSALMLLLALQFGGNDYPWNSSVVIGLFVGSGVMAILFVLWEHHVGDEKAMIPLGMLKKRVVCTSALVGGINMSVTLVGSYYLPMYFQSVKGETPFKGGVDYLPTILAQLISAVTSGALVGRMGYYLPWVFIGAGFSAVGSGLISTWVPTTATGIWIGYQIILGIGRGSSMQMHIIAIQANLPPSLLSVSMATLVFAQTLSGAVFLTFAELIFTEGLGKNLEKYAPSVDAKTILAAGGTGFREVVSASELPGVVMAYSKSISEVFYLCVALSGCVFILGWGMGWVDIRKKKAEKKGDV
ncbi:Efflux pump mlcE [Colletotrichum sp. SAR 10_96]|nr:Efflux pump mlcE [Colletotrichum sp. SAR 10_96]